MSNAQYTKPYNYEFEVILLFYSGHTINCPGPILRRRQSVHFI